MNAKLQQFIKRRKSDIDLLVSDYVSVMNWDDGMLSHPSDYFVDTRNALKSQFNIDGELLNDVQNYFEKKVIDSLFYLNENKQKFSTISFHLRGNINTRTVFLNGKQLLPSESQKIYNHSPDGFNWGYGGSGPSQLSLAICFELTKDKELSSKIYQSFKWDFVSKLPRKNFDLQCFLDINKYLDKSNDSSQSFLL